MFEGVMRLLKAEVTLIKSILEQYCQLFSEYSESPVLFSELEERTNKSKLSAPAKPKKPHLFETGGKYQDTLLPEHFGPDYIKWWKSESSSAMESCPFPVTN